MEQERGIPQTQQKMSDYSSLPSYRSSPDQKQQQQMLQTIKSQLALANAQEIVQVSQRSYG